MRTTIEIITNESHYRKCAKEIYELLNPEDKTINTNNIKNYPVAKTISDFHSFMGSPAVHDDNEKFRK